MRHPNLVPLKDLLLSVKLNSVISVYDYLQKGQLLIYN